MMTEEIIEAKNVSVDVEVVVHTDMKTLFDLRKKNKGMIFKTPKGYYLIYALHGLKQLVAFVADKNPKGYEIIKVDNVKILPQSTSIIEMNVKSLKKFAKKFQQVIWETEDNYFIIHHTDVIIAEKKKKKKGYIE